MLLRNLLYLLPWFGAHIRVIVPSEKKGVFRVVPVKDKEKLTAKDQLVLIKYFRIFGRHYPLKVIELPTRS
jgi:hypothetical protein